MRGGVRLNPSQPHTGIPPSYAPLPNQPFFRHHLFLLLLSSFHHHQNPGPRLCLRLWRSQLPLRHDRSTKGHRHHPLLFLLSFLFLFLFLHAAHHPAGYATPLPPVRVDAASSRSAASAGFCRRRLSVSRLRRGGNRVSADL